MKNKIGAIVNDKTGEIVYIHEQLRNNFDTVPTLGYAKDIYVVLESPDGITSMLNVIRQDDGSHGLTTRNYSEIYFPETRFCEDTSSFFVNKTIGEIK